MRSMLIVLGMLVGASALRGGAEVNPIRKVVNMLENLQKEIQAEGDKEKVLYDNFMCFCDNGAADLLKTANDAKAANKAGIAKLESDTAEKTQLEADIKQHETDEATATKDLETATNVRNSEKETYDETLGTKSASEAALGKAIPAIEKGMGGSFLQTEGYSHGLMKKLTRAVHAAQQLT